MALPEKQKYVIDYEGDLDAFDEPTYVNNSDMSFFYKNDQLSTYREQRKAEKESYFKMNESIVTTDFTKNEVSLLPDISNSYTGSHNVIVHNGKVKEFESANAVEYTLKGGAKVPVSEAFEVILSNELLGRTQNTPHTIAKGNTYYAAFTSELESVYFAFESGNEFVSVVIDGLHGRVSYELLDENMHPIKNGFNAEPHLEIQYKGKGAKVYYLKLTGSYAEQLSPFSIKLPSDNNEWMWQMAYEDMDKDITGSFDYYGDEDFFVLPPRVTENINKSILRFTNASHQINVVIYDKNRSVVGQYVYNPANPEPISMYGLADAYAASVYSYDGDSSGASYTFRFEHTEINILDIQTYGFILSPQYNEQTDYYTASVASIKGKQITEVMHSPPEASVVITVEQQCGYKSVTTLGKDLELGLGRNKVTLSVTTGGATKEITIMISDKTYDLSYGFMLAKHDGIPKGAGVMIISHNDEKSETQIQLCDVSKIDQKQDYQVDMSRIGQYLWVPDEYIFSGYKETTMPDEYKDSINALKEKYPNWKFTFVKTGYTLEEYVKTQEGKDSAYASVEDITYYVNPANFLTEQKIFMFEKQNYAEGSYTEQGVESIWRNDNKTMFVPYIMDASISTGLSPYFIAARAGLESGYGTSKLATGGCTGYSGYYNMFGIGANDLNPTNGALFAKNRNWNSRRRAMIEGAAWIKDKYIGCQQYTIYFMKYCFIPDRQWHQYMTDIKAPSKDAVNYFNSHWNGGSLSSEHEFVIPVFD